ncbi:MAG: hypothetical protein ACPG7U_03780, partial [Holosporaceae bacterium]
PTFAPWAVFLFSNIGTVLPVVESLLMFLSLEPIFWYAPKTPKDTFCLTSSAQAAVVVIKAAPVHKKRADFLTICRITSITPKKNKLLKQNLDHILCLFFFISNKRSNRFVINVFFSLTKGSFLLRRLFMQTKNMRFLKASVLCLSVFLLKQTGHAGLGDKMKDYAFKADNSFYTGVTLVPEQEIERHSNEMASLQLDWLLPLDPTQAKDHKLVQQRAAHRHEFVGAFPWALDTLGSVPQSLKDFRKTLGAIASGQSATVTDVSNHDVKTALQNLAVNAPEGNSRLSRLVLRKVAFECSKVAKTIKEAPDAEQAGLMQNALQELQSTNVLQHLAVQPFANEFQALFQQASASAGKTSPRKTKSRSSQNAQRPLVSNSVGGAASLAAQGLPSASVGSSFGFGAPQQQGPSVRPHVRHQVESQTSSSSSDDEAAPVENPSYGLNDYGQPVSHNPQTQSSGWGYSRPRTAQLVNLADEDEEEVSSRLPQMPSAQNTPFDDRELGEQGAEPPFNGRLSRTPSMVNRVNLVEQNYQQARNALEELARGNDSEDVISRACDAAQMLLPTLTEEQKAEVQNCLTSMQQGLGQGAYGRNAEKAVNQFGGVADLMKAFGLEVPEDDDHISSSSSSDSDSEATVVEEGD